MKKLAGVFLAMLLVLHHACGQGFVNLNFEHTTIRTNPGSGGTYTPTLPGWGVYGFPYGNPTNVWFNTIALDAPAVTLQGTNSPFLPAIQGKYSVLLQGGTQAGGYAYNTNGASVFQTGQIPATAQSLTYLGGSALQVAFDGHSLLPIALDSFANYTIWSVDVSAYSGQTGELRFTAPWLSTSILDGIQFSPTSVPEPNVLALAAVLILSLFGKLKPPE